jgi:hypothetical protein
MWYALLPATECKRSFSSVAGFDISWSLTPRKPTLMAPEAQLRCKGEPVVVLKQAKECEPLSPPADLSSMKHTFAQAIQETRKIDYLLQRHKSGAVCTN